LTPAFVPSQLLAPLAPPPEPAPLRTQALWLPGDFLSTNAMLDLQRAAGYHAGMRHSARGLQRARAAGPAQSYAIEARRIRTYAATLARKHLEPLPADRWVRLAFYLLGHPRYDASAWYLPAKHVEDGLADAGVIGSDRHDVHSTEGRCVRSAEEAKILIARAGGTVVQSGMIVEVQPWG